MKLSKEIEEKIENAITQFEQEEREGTVKFYSNEEAFEIMFNGRYARKKV